MTNINNFSSRIRQFTDRLKTSTRIDNFFAESSGSEGQALAKELQAAGECVTQLSQVVMEVEILNQLHSRLVYEKEALQQEKADLETNVFELQQERNEIEPQVMYLREQLSQASIQLEQTQNRERNLSDRERQLTDIVAQLERRRAVLNQTIENLTNQEADYIVRTQELGKIVDEAEKKAKGYIDAVNYYQTWLNELKAQVEEEEGRLRAMGIEPPAYTPPEPEPLEEQYSKIPEPSYMPSQPAQPAYSEYSYETFEAQPADDYWDALMPPPPEPAPEWSQQPAAQWSQSTHSGWSSPSDSDWNRGSNSDWSRDPDSEWSRGSNSDWNRGSNSDWSRDPGSDWNRGSNSDWSRDSAPEWPPVDPPPEKSKYNNSSSSSNSTSNSNSSSSVFNEDPWA